MPTCISTALETVQSHCGSLETKDLGYLPWRRYEVNL